MKTTQAIILLAITNLTLRVLGLPSLGIKHSTSARNQGFDVFTARVTYTTAQIQT